MKISASNRWRKLFYLSAGYCVLLLIVTPLRPLWTDEVLQLYISRQAVNHEFFDQIRQNAGATPLGYLVAAASERLLGIGRAAARLPALAAGIAAAVSLFGLSVETGASLPILAWVLFAICPLQLRYAAEGRPYELALLCSILATIYAVRLYREPSTKNTATYCLLLVAGIYLQPFVAFAAAGNGLWIAWEASEHARCVPQSASLPPR